MECIWRCLFCIRYRNHYRVFYIPHGGDFQQTKALARNADPRRTTFFQVVFSQKTKAPARNADPRRIACVSHLSSRRHGRGKKMFTPLGTNCHPGGQICCGADFGSRLKISGHPLGQSASFFEIYLLRLVLGGLTPSQPQQFQNRGWGGTPQQQFICSGWGGLTPPAAPGSGQGGQPPTARVAAIRGCFGPGGG